jgi:hypothetical protein
MMSLLVGALAAGAGATQPPQAEPIDPAEIVVTGRRGGPAAHPDAVEFLKALCFDPARRTGRLAPPVGNPHWVPLEDDARRQFKIEHPDTPAFSLVDGGRGHELWLKFEESSLPDGLVEQRCTMLVAGGRDHDRFVNNMSQLFRGIPTQRHVGHPNGVPRVRGLSQWLWTGGPQRGSKVWRSIQQPKGAQTTWRVVIDADAYYQENDYIVGDLKIRNGPGEQASLLTFAVTRRRG